MADLTNKDLELLAVIENTYKTTFFAPSLAEAAEAMGMSKGSVIADMFKRLEAAGAIYYSVNRKQYLPRRWRELVAGAMPSEFEALQDENEKLRRKFAEYKKNNKNAELERLRAQNRARAQAFRDRQKTIQK